jgi:hypothetical protein
VTRRRDRRRRVAPRARTARARKAAARAALGAAARILALGAAALLAAGGCGGGPTAHPTDLRASELDLARLRRGFREGGCFERPLSGIRTVPPRARLRVSCPDVVELVLVEERGELYATCGDADRERCLRRVRDAHAQFQGRPSR